MTPHLCRLAREASSLGGGDEVLRQRSEQWPRFRGLVVPMLIGMVGCSSSTRAKLWAADGADVFLLLLREQVRDYWSIWWGIRGRHGWESEGKPFAPPLHYRPPSATRPVRPSPPCLCHPCARPPTARPLYRIQACKQACCRHWTHGWARI